MPAHFGQAVICEMSSTITLLLDNARNHLFWSPLAILVLLFWVMAGTSTLDYLPVLWLDASASIFVNGLWAVGVSVAFPPVLSCML